MAYVPRPRRLDQLAAAERLLLSIEPDQAYPRAFVTHAITGYRPGDTDRRAADEGSVGSLLTGVALQHDLGLLLEQVSGDMLLASDDAALAGEPVLDLAAACDRFGVTSKTLQRWRRKGLPARKFVFPDGKQRVGFRLACVEAFVARTEQQDGRRGAAVDATPVTAALGDVLASDEQTRLVQSARRLAVAGHDAREVVRRVARRSGRSVLAVRQTLERFDATHPAEAVLVDCPPPLRDAEARLAARQVEQGQPLRDVAARLGRPRAAVYRAIVESRAERLASANVKYHDDELFEGDPAEAERQVAAVLAASNEDASSVTADRPPRGLPPYLAELYRTPLLTPARERALFLAYNFHKSRLATLRSQLDPRLCRLRDLTAMERHLELARDRRNEILAANLRLVVSVARKHVRPGLELMDLVSDGNIVLMRAVEGFDPRKGFKFSTYATLALVKGYARSVPQMQARRAVSDAAGRERATHDLGPQRVAGREQLARLLTRLDRRERRAVAAAWNLSGRTIDGVARRMGTTRRVVRDLERSAMQKLRTATSDVAAT